MNFLNVQVKRLSRESCLGMKASVIECQGRSLIILKIICNLLMSKVQVT